MAWRETRAPSPVPTLRSSDLSLPTAQITVLLLRVSLHVWQVKAGSPRGWSLVSWCATGIGCAITYLHVEVYGVAFDIVRSD